jgi:hypothetical protein
MSGREYAWSPEHHPKETELAVAPEWLLGRLTTRSSRGSSSGQVAPIPSDEWSQITRQTITEYRDRAATQIIGHLLRHNCDPDLAAGLLHAWNKAMCDPPLDADELDKITGRIEAREAQRIERGLYR